MSDKKDDRVSPGRDGEAVLRVEEVVKDYRIGRHSLRVLHGVDLAVGKGEFLSIEGPSGAGKSTLLHIMGILDTPTGGRVIYEGENIAGLSDKKRAHRRNRLFGFVFQFYHLLPDLAAEENVAIPALASLGATGWLRGRRMALKRSR